MQEKNMPLQKNWGLAEGIGLDDIVRPTMTSISANANGTRNAG